MLLCKLTATATTAQQRWSRRCITGCCSPGLLQQQLLLGREDDRHRVHGCAAPDVHGRLLLAIGISPHAPDVLRASKVTRRNPFAIMFEITVEQPADALIKSVVIISFTTSSCIEPGVVNEAGQAVARWVIHPLGQPHV
jgi:hypothetical protein